MPPFMVEGQFRRLANINDMLAELKSLQFQLRSFQALSSFVAGRMPELISAMKKQNYPDRSIHQISGHLFGGGIKGVKQQARRMVAFCQKEGNFFMWLKLLTKLHGAKLSARDLKFLNDAITFEEEMADIPIRVMDMAEHKKMDLEGHILAKMRFNTMREKYHGKKY